MSFYPCKGKIYPYNGQGKDKENGIAWGKAGIKVLHLLDLNRTLCPINTFI